MDLAFVVAGLVMLLFGGDALVRGAVALSLRLGVPALIVSLTVVAFGTSAPELLIGVQAALEGAPGIAFGNVVGSNIANVLLVLGVPALLKGITTEGSGSGRNYALMVFSSLIFIGLCALGPLETWHGLLLLALLGVMLFDAYRASMVARRNATVLGQGDGTAAIVGGEPEIDEEDVLDEIDEATRDMPLPKALLFLIGGLILLPLGAHLLIDGARAIAMSVGVSEAVIGLTLVAIGTSLPELATTIMATFRNQCDVAIGNVIGSNMFNILAIMGITSFFGPLPVPEGFLTYDLWVMLAASLILIPFVWVLPRIGRGWGLLFLAAYVGYTWSIV
ncbi:MAG: calcium/sodium antiporter [Pseudomonadota bacterium]